MISILAQVKIHPFLSPRHSQRSENYTQVFPGPALEAINKATGQVVMSSATATASDVEVAVKSSAEAFRSFRKIPAAERGNLLLKAGGTIFQLIFDKIFTFVNILSIFS